MDKNNQFNEVIHQKRKPFFEMNDFDDRMGIYFLVMIIAVIWISYPLFFLGLDGKLATGIGCVIGWFVANQLIRSIRKKQETR